MKRPWMAPLLTAVRRDACLDNSFGSRAAPPIAIDPLDWPYWRGPGRQQHQPRDGPARHDQPRRQPGRRRQQPALEARRPGRPQHADRPARQALHDPAGRSRHADRRRARRLHRCRHGQGHLAIAAQRLVERRARHARRLVERRRRSRNGPRLCPRGLRPVRVLRRRHGQDRLVDSAARAARRALDLWRPHEFPRRLRRPGDPRLGRHRLGRHGDARPTASSASTRRPARFAGSSAPAPAAETRSTAPRCSPRSSTARSC